VTTSQRDHVDAFLDRALEIFPSLDPEVEGIVDRIVSLNKHLERQAEAGSTAHGVNRGEFRVLLRLRQSPQHRSSPGDLASMCMLSTGATTNRLDGLEEAGLIERSRDPDDRRGVIVSLTDRGEAVVGAAVAEIGEAERGALAALTSAEQRRLNALLRTLLVSFEADA
jgi:DNA-binding MarR family transcriptional regulator